MKPKSVTVTAKGFKYYPKAYMLSFDSKGNVIHTAILKDRKANSEVYVNLGGVEYEEKNS